ncbi:hypothetical protein FEM48_Zijuj03G0088500 [Ziziphus jujuba var. spinosa]|uniref:Uncharacterized protein n=1 Tax=Ziziphus jujuba var. spinosa TaxID=714518 RepID=A0A978VPC6_ZIZJJ|nr:hypothetical protein FEM48_Zijuj03G0088500 [Ziziphus jujuba var. spinosa]
MCLLIPKTVAVAPYIVNDSGAPFRQYPEAGQEFNISIYVYFLTKNTCFCAVQTIMRSMKEGLESLMATNKAIELEPLMAKAYLRKSSACIKLEEYQIAKATLETGASLASEEARFTNVLLSVQFKRCQGHGRSCLKKQMALMLVLMQADTLKCKLIALEKMHHMNHLMLEHIAAVSYITNKNALLACL